MDVTRSFPSNWVCIAAEVLATGSSHVPWESWCIETISSPFPAHVSGTCEVAALFSRANQCISEEGSWRSCCVATKTAGADCSVFIGRVLSRPSGRRTATLLWAKRPSGITLRYNLHAASPEIYMDPLCADVVSSMHFLKNRRCTGSLRVTLNRDVCAQRQLILQCECSGCPVRPPPNSQSSSKWLRVCGVVWRSRPPN